MNNTNYGHSAPAKQQAALTPEQRAAKRQAAAQQRAEWWEERVRSTDPHQRGAGWWPSLPSAKGEPHRKRTTLQSLAELAETPRPAKVARVIDPNTEPLRDRIKPLRAGSAKATPLKAQKAFLECAAFFGAVVLELNEARCRRWVFDVAISQTPGIPCQHVQRWTLVFSQSAPTITQAQIPADMPMLSEEYVITRPPNFPDDTDLDWLIEEGFDPTLDAFEVRMFRRNARDLRKGLFGTSGLRDVPDHRGGVMEFPLPRGWTLELDYRPCSVGDFDRPGEVMAYFIPPEADEQGVAA